MAKVKHPIAIVIFVPIDVPGLEDCDGVEYLEQGGGVTAVAAGSEGGAALIGAAAIADESVALALDALLIAARRVQDLIPGADVQATAWFGGAEFQEM